MTDYDIHKELLALTKATIPYRASYQECATPDCVRAAVGSYCIECSEELDKALDEALDARECPHSRVSYERNDQGNYAAFCHDCVSEIEVDWKDYDGDIL